MSGRHYLYRGAKTATGGGPRYGYSRIRSKSTFHIEIRLAGQVATEKNDTLSFAFTARVGYVAGLTWNRCTTPFYSRGSQHVDFNVFQALSRMEGCKWGAGRSRFDFTCSDRRPTVVMIVGGDDTRHYTQPYFYSLSAKGLCDFASTRVRFPVSECTTAIKIRLKGEN